MTIQLPFPLKNKHFAAISAFLFGMFVHFFALVNITQNVDNIATPEGIGGGASSGRWFLELIDIVFSKFMVGSYNLHWLNGVAYLLVIAVAAYFLVSVLEIRNRLSAILIGMAVVSFPSAGVTMLYRFTSVQYGIAMLFSILAAWSLMRWKYGIIPSVLFSACSLGIYQAFLPMTVSIFVLVLLRQTLEGEEKVSKLFLRGVYCCVSIVISIAVYLAISNFIMARFVDTADVYETVDEMGRLNLREIPSLVVNAFVTFFTSPRYGYEIIQTTFMSLLYICLGVSAVGMAGYILAAKVRKIPHILFACFLCLVFPIAVNLITIMAPGGSYYTLMVYPYVMVLVLPLLVFDVLALDESRPVLVKKLVQRVVCLLLAALIFCNTYYINLNYQISYYTTRQMENYLSGLITQVRMTEGFTPEKKWAFLGTASDPLLDSFWEEIAWHLGYGGNSHMVYLLGYYSWQSWIYTYVGYTMPEADAAEIEMLRQSQEVQAMNTWPSQGSIKVIDDFVVVKFR